jgi:hypothetical protein
MDVISQRIGDRPQFVFFANTCGQQPPIVPYIISDENALLFIDAEKYPRPFLLFGSHEFLDPWYLLQMSIDMDLPGYLNF